MTMLVGLVAHAHAKDQRGHTAIHYAAFQGQVVSIKKLVGLGFDAHLENQDGHTTLYSANCNGHADAVNALTELGADIHAQYDGGTLIHIAAVHGQVQVIKALVELGVINVHARDNYGLTALHMPAGAEKSKNVEATKVNSIAEAAARQCAAVDPAELAARQAAANAAVAPLLEEEQNKMATSGQKVRTCMFRAERAPPHGLSYITPTASGLRAVDLRNTATSRQCWEKWTGSHRETSARAP
ncbi:hypothetical protein CYMTET_36761 [Cymbomonas tetramitiformis]|uniref:Uncharacterized protein n=1 Tax=Cymbomonas tetramitiformis TaxID=36881 RepID=A0AAE0CF99_9CHLO|nr:hypothetical protein CYMTET_36761 [Cymbomonas tetramitiformis]